MFVCVCDSFEYGVYYFGLVSIFLCYTVVFIDVVLCIHWYVDEAVNHGVESGVFVLYEMVWAVVFEA